MAIITPALGAARASLNRRFPGRDKASDGWIGDAAHQGSRSGHNPDETGNAEYADSDNLDEVRAVDLDDDLRHPSLTMHDVVRAILATPADRDRCSYLIYDETIWSRSAGYQPRAYTGANKHTSHLHISGRPANDADDRPWLSIERLGIEEDDMAWDEEIKNRIWPTEEEATGRTMRADDRLVQTQGRTAAILSEVRKLGGLPGAVATLRGMVAGLAGQDVAEEVRAAVDEAFTAATDRLADAVAARVPAAGRDEVAAALREVLGSVDES